MDIAIYNTTLITMQGEGLGVILNATIGIQDGLITYLGKTDTINYKSADHIIDGTNHITMPGFINSHIHSGMTLLRGAAQDVPEIEWMNKSIGPFVKHMNKDDLIVGSKLGVLEGLRSGTTTFAEYANNVKDIVNSVYIPWGIRVVAIETINEVSRDRSRLKSTDLYEFDPDKGYVAFKRAKQIFRAYKDNSLVSSMFGPQALDMISIKLLKDIQKECRAKSSKIQMHVAQGERERLQIKGRFGKDMSTVKVLSTHDLLDSNLVAVHIHDTIPQERKLLVEKGVGMVGCPSSISMIDGIVPPIAHFRSLGGIAGLGTDQAPGPGHHNMVRELRTISLLSKVIKQDPTNLPAWEALKLGTVLGSHILDLDKKIGTLEVGKQADIITINLKKVNMSPVVFKPFYNFIPNLVYSMTGNEVDNVLIKGKFILKDSEFQGIDTEAIIIEVNRRASRVFDDAEDDWIQADSKIVEFHKKGFL
ncbi:MAG: amidohydrolase family protein [Candidatus Hodarchaeales archaeon]|jgi:5-methylthioadenosine/S-adenosylhomocysteine deaminase